MRASGSAGIIATLEHFAGCSAFKAARNHAPVSMGRREFADVVLPPWEGGTRKMMNSYADVDGVPAGANPPCFPNCCAKWGFEGMVVSDC